MSDADVTAGSTEGQEQAPKEDAAPSTEASAPAEAGTSSAPASEAPDPVLYPSDAPPPDGPAAPAEPVEPTAVEPTEETVTILKSELDGLRVERNLVVKALAKAAMATNHRVGWLFHDERPVLTIVTREYGPIGFHFSDEEREAFPGINVLQCEFDGATDEQRADRLERLVLK